eukprot:482888_1
MYSAFNRIDKALAIYYTNHGRKDYYDENGDGKFIAFVHENDFDENAIDLELGDNVNPNDCLYLSMDNGFPLIDETQRSQQIFEILTHCYVNGMPPYNKMKQNALTINDLQIISFIIGSINKNEITKNTSKLNKESVIKFIRSKNITFELLTNIRKSEFVKLFQKGCDTKMMIPSLKKLYKSIQSIKPFMQYIIYNKIDIFTFNNDDTDTVLKIISQCNLSESSSKLITNVYIELKNIENCARIISLSIENVNNKDIKNEKQKINEESVVKFIRSNNITFSFLAKKSKMNFVNLLKEGCSIKMKPPL